MTIRLNPADLSQTRSDLGLTIGTSDGNVIAADATGLPAINGSQVTALNASNLASGTVPSARLPAVGKVVKFQNAFVATDASTTSTFPDDDTIPQSSEGAEYTTVAYTPTEAGNKIVIQINAQAATSNAAIVVVVALFKNSETDATKVAWEETHGNGPIVMNLIHEDTAADTSEITYKLRYGSSGNTGTVYLGSQHHSGARFGDKSGIAIHITEYDA
jgi:hypothetical protein